MQCVYTYSENLFGLSIFVLMSYNKNQSFFPAEWYPQSAVHFVWPCENSDWKANYKQVVSCYVAIVKAVLGRQKLLMTFPEHHDLDKLFTAEEQSKMDITHASYNDTWVRDYGGIAVFDQGNLHLLDFKFNAWGNKFDWKLDNEQTRELFNNGSFRDTVNYQSHLDFVLEGGAVESNGNGLLLTTESCLLNPNRNGELNKMELEKKIKRVLQVKKILWLKHGKIEGDDTDGHVDTLVRFVNESTLVYVKCSDIEDSDFHELNLMEKELEVICAQNELSMVSLPVPQVVVHPNTSKRLPATYANFLIINNAVLLPSYACPQDELAIKTLQTCFPDREIISINCLALIAQGGSLHCASMQYPIGFIN
jgi:agmatine deiminase